MESQRSLLFIALIAVSFLLYEQWQIDHAPNNANNPVTQQVNNTANSNDDFIPASSKETQTSVDTNNHKNNAQFISVKTDVLDVEINTQGGDIVNAKLLKYETKQGGKIPFTLLEKKPHEYIAQSGLTGTNGIDRTIPGRPIYQTTKTAFNLSNQDSITVDLSYTDEQALTVIKRFTFKKSSYAITVDYIITNNTNQNASVQVYGQLRQSTLKNQSSGMMPTSAYWGAAYSTVDDKYQKYKFSEIEDKNLNETTQGGWIAMIQHYFVTAWIPDKDQSNSLYSTYSTNSNEAVIGFKAPAIAIAPHTKINTSTVLYIGPKDQKTMATIAKGLDLTVDYGFLFFISQPLFWLLVKIHSIVGNWGFAIIVITLIVKGAMYPLTKAQYSSMARMRELQPKIASLKDRFGSDRQKMSQAMMELYKKEKVNPAGGCLPLLVQMPIFMALYWVFLESVELRHATFGLWIQDLSARDPYFILPIIYGITMFVMQKLQPMTVQDPMQQKMMQYMPILFTFFFFMFPSGLVLYWVVSNIISIVQMKIIFAGIAKKKKLSNKEA